MRIGFLADSHFGKTGLADSRRAHNFIVQDMERRGVDLVLHGGDVFDSADPHPRVVKAASDLFVRLSEKRPVVVVRGNHDSSESMAILNTLPTSHHVTVEQDVGLHKVLTRRGYVWVLGISWNESLDSEQNLPTAEAARVVGHAAREEPLLVVGHLLVRGAVPSLGQLRDMPDRMLRKGYTETPIESLRGTGADAIFLGHIHARQQWEDGALVAYSGSPVRFHPEEMDPKCYIVADISPGKRIAWARIDIPARS